MMKITFSNNYFNGLTLTNKLDTDINNLRRKVFRQETRKTKITMTQQDREYM